LKITGNRILKKIFGTKINEVTREWILYFLPNFVAVVKWKRLRWIQNALKSN
jgi:hypothetical protein